MKLRETFLKTGVLAELDKLAGMKRLTPEALVIIERVHCQLEELPARMVVFEREIGAKRLPLERDVIAIIGYLSSQRQKMHEAFLLEQNPDLAYIALFQRNGHVRQLALQSIQRPPSSGFFLAALLQRLNDWARPVRQAALQCLAGILPRVAPTTVLEVSEYLLLRAKSWQRLDEEAKELITQLVTREDIVEALTRHFASNSPGPLSRMLFSVLRHSAYDKHLSFLAKHARNASVRRVAAKALISERADLFLGYGFEWVDKVYGRKKRVKNFAHRPLTIVVNPSEIIELGLLDPSAMVRRVIAQSVIDRRFQLPNLNEYVRMLCNDKNLSIKERGNWLRRQE